MTLRLMVLVVTLVMAGCAGGKSGALDAAKAAGSDQADETRAIAHEAFIYGFPLVTNYATLHKQVVDTTGPDYRGPFNVVASTARVATPADTFVVTPNSDTPYSFLWLDLRAEPVVITVPKIEKGRYYTGQLIDLYTHNFAYVGSRSFGNRGGRYLVTGPGWKGTKPKGIDAVFPCETEFAYVLFRTQLFGPADLPTVKKIQNGYRAETLSAYLKQTPPKPAPTVAWPPPSPAMLSTPELFTYLNFVLQFCPTHPSETELMERFAKIGIGAGKRFDVATLTPAVRRSMDAGIKDAWKDLASLQKEIDAEDVASSDFFGTREFLKNNYLYRFAGAKLGLYGNSGSEAIYLSYFVDADGKPTDASRTGYVLRFPKGQLPPAGAFWSVTMYDGKSQLLVANPLDRYLVNSTMLKQFVHDPDGGLTFSIRKDSPGVKKEPNWLPAPNGPFYLVLRIYEPKPNVLDHSWRKPALTPAS